MKMIMPDEDLMGLRENGSVCPGGPKVLMATVRHMDMVCRSGGSVFDLTLSNKDRLANSCSDSDKNELVNCPYSLEGTTASATVAEYIAVKLAELEESDGITVDSLSYDMAKGNIVIDVSAV